MLNLTHFYIISMKVTLFNLLFASPYRNIFQNSFFADRLNFIDYIAVTTFLILLLLAPEIWVFFRTFQHFESIKIQYDIAKSSISAEYFSRQDVQCSIVHVNIFFHLFFSQCSHLCKVIKVVLYYCYDVQSYMRANYQLSIINYHIFVHQVITSFSVT